MTALPPATDFTGAAVTEGDFKTAVTNMRAYLAGITDTTGIVADARTQLGLGSLAIKSTIATADVDAGAITAAKLGTSAVETAKINALAVTTGKLALLSVDTGQLAASAVETAKIAANAVTLAKMADSVQGEILYFGASGVIAVLGAGTAGHFLKTLGAGANPAWAAVAAGQWQFLERQTISSIQSEVDFEDGTWSDYDAIQLRFHDLRPAEDGKMLRIRLSAGGAYDTATKYGYGVTSLVINATGVTESNLGDDIKDRIDLFSGGAPGFLRTTAEFSCSGEFTIYGPDSAFARNFTFSMSAGRILDGVSITGSGYYYGNLGTALDGIRLYMSGGNVDEMIGSTWGLLKA